MNENDIHQLIVDSIITAGSSKNLKASDFTANTPLQGDGSPLDSVDLVMSIVAIESEFNTATGASTNLSEAVALPPDQSPFRTLGILVTYLKESL